MTKRPEIAVDIGMFMLSSPRFKLLLVDNLTFRRAWGIFRKYSGVKLSFTNATSLALMEKYRIKYIASFDKHFDGIVQRIH